MSGSSRRRHSKWDDRDSEALSENFFEKDPPRKTREPPSPSRGSHRHKSHRRERIMPSDREDDNIRPSPGLDEWRYQHPSRSPRNGRGRLYRSRSRSRSQSPAYNYRQEPALTERSRGKSGGSATICRDFIAGGCRRGTHCFFLHQDAEFSDSRRPLGRSPPDSWENKDRRIGGSRYSADDNKEYSVRSEKSGNLCDDFLKGRCRRGSSCRFAHHERPMADAFKKGHGDDVYRDRDKNRQIQGNYPDRNHGIEISRRVVTPCKFFAAGNCRNENRCKFSHQIRENFSPERRSQDDRRGSDRKLDLSPASDEPRWSNARRVSNVPTVHDWEEDKETLAVNSVKLGNDSRDHGRVKIKQTWDAPTGTDEPKTGDERQTLRWKKENSGAAIGMDNIPGEMEISPKNVSKQRSSSLYSETPSLSNISFPTVQVDTTSETPHDNHYHYDFPEPKVSCDLYAEQNPNFEHKLNVYAEEGKKNVGSDRMCITPNPPMNVQPAQSVFQNDPPVNAGPTLSINSPPVQLQFPLRPGGGNTMQLSPLNPSINAPVGRVISPGDPRVKFRPTISMNPPAGQGLPLLLPLHSSGGNGMQTSHDHSSLFDNNNNKAADGPPGDQSVNFQPLSRINPSAAQVQLSLPLHSGGNGMQTSHNPTMFVNNNAADGPHLDNANVMQPVPNHSSVSNEQLAQLSHLSLSLAQLLERQQQLNLSSASNPSGISSLPDTASSIPSVSNATIQPSQAPEIAKQYDPISDIIEQTMPKSGDQKLPNIAEQKSSDNELCLENNQEEPYKMSKDGGEIAEVGNKAPENKLSENIVADDGDEDGTKSKDSKGLRSFKFALADYTKELLKPAWKDGKVNKESYKTIVKRVVDKVIETQGPQIPQTKEKIDQYLSCSKAKLEKLVQAYVGKYKT